MNLAAVERRAPGKRQSKEVFGLPYRYQRAFTQICQNLIAGISFLLLGWKS